MTTPPAGRVAQRRRTRKDIVDATATLLTEGQEPSVSEIAATADVSRRTVYLHFPSLEQLLIDATLGAMSLKDGYDANRYGADARRRVRGLAETLLAMSDREGAATGAPPGSRKPSNPCADNSSRNRPND